MIQKNKYGQYFTPNMVAEFMIDLSDIPVTAKILEPSCGEGIFLELLQRKGFHHLTAYEIDDSLAKKFSFVQHESFVTADIKDKFDLMYLKIMMETVTLSKIGVSLKWYIFSK